MSMMADIEFGLLLSRLKTALNGRVLGDFKTIAVILMGDFSQLPPVGFGACPLYASAVQGCTAAGAAFRQFDIFSLSANQRVDVDDVDHVDTVRALGDINVEFPVTDVIINRLANMQLKPADFTDPTDAFKWKAATLVTATHAVGFQINKVSITLRHPH